MIKVGDLPHLNERGVFEHTELPEVAQSTAHTVTLRYPSKRRCHRCGKYVGTFVSKPGSPNSWCLSCW